MANGKYNPADFESVEFGKGYTEEGAPEGEENEFMSEDGQGTEQKYSEQELVSAKEELVQQFLLHPERLEISGFAQESVDGEGLENIQGVGIGYKLAGESQTNELTTIVYVARKVSANMIAGQALIPQEIGGVEVDVQEIGEINAQLFNKKVRPAPYGVSVGHYNITAGTLGCLAKPIKSPLKPPLYILSNNHVLADVNKGKAGDAILQPGKYDGGVIPGDVIAKLTRFVPIDMTGKCNYVDAAIAQTDPKLVVPKTVCKYPVSDKVVPAKLTMPVKKCGRTTQFTRGRITDINFTGWVGYGNAGKALFCNQIVVQSVDAKPFSAGGDSGSLIVTDEKAGNPVGLLFAGSSTHTIANPIAKVLAALSIKIVPAI
jgi:hypothetical protein